MGIRVLHSWYALALGCACLGYACAPGHACLRGARAPGHACSLVRKRLGGTCKYDGQPKFPMDLSGQGRDQMLVGAKNVKYLPQKWCGFNPNSNGNISNLGDNINYACTFSDCTSLGYGSSCNNLDANGNASYAFNMYFQAQNQKDMSCFFQGLGMITTQNYSQDQCSFIVQLAPSASSPSASPLLAVLLVSVPVLMFFLA